VAPYLASSPHRRRFAVAGFSLLVILSMILVACGGGNTTTTTSGHATTLRLTSAPGQTNPDLFNPFFNTNQGGDWGAQGMLYEELFFTNLYTGQTTPWLASSYSYSKDLTQLTFTIRSGVKWNDGQAFTSQDVVFTFNLMKANPTLDQNGVMPLVRSVSAPDSNTVVFTLQHPDSTALFRIGDQVFIVPQHVWANISGDPAKFANDKNPVGTGPYLLKSWSPDLITYTINPNYWGSTKPQVQTIQVLSIKDNTTAITDMIQGKLDWMGTGWNPDYDPLFSQKDPQHNHTFFAASNTVMLYMNLQKAPFNNLLVRKAISAAINRSKLPQGVAQYAKVANPTGVIIPTLNNWIAPQYQNMGFQYSTSQADSYLQQAGYSKGSDGFYQKNGKDFTMSVDVVNGWSDWDQDVQFIVNDLKAAGINASVNSESGYTPYYTAISTGTYDAAISWTNVGPTPYFAYQALLSSSNSAPPGQAVVGTNFERWDASTSGGFSTQTDKLINQYESTIDPNAQKQAMQGIEDIMVSQLPAIPLTVNVNWDEYTTKNWVGWPSTDNPYDYGAPFQMPDAENVVLHLTSAS